MYSPIEISRFSAPVTARFDAPGSIKLRENLSCLVSYSSVSPLITAPSPIPPAIMTEPSIVYSGLLSTGLLGGSPVLKSIMKKESPDTTRARPVRSSASLTLAISRHLLQVG